MRGTEAKRDADMIMKALDLLNTACENIRDRGQCHNGDTCPMRLYCIAGEYGTASISELFENTTAGTWIEFLRYADEYLVDDSALEDIYRNVF